MSGSNGVPWNKVLIASDIHPIGDKLVRAVESIFADHKQTAFRVAHVTEPNYVPVLATGYVGEFMGMDLSGVIAGEAYTEAERLLQNQTRDMFQNRELVTSVLRGKPSEELATEATNTGSEVIFVSPGELEERHTLLGFSTTLNLISRSKVPIWSLPQSAIKDGFTAPKCILIADDLSSGCSGAVKFAANLQRLFPEANVLHLHVRDIDDRDLKSFVSHMKEEMNLGRAPFIEDFSPQKLRERIHKGIEAGIADRWKLVGGNPDHHKAVVMLGKLKERLEEELGNHKPDMLVFGQHDTFHMRPLAIGKMPFHSMLEYHLPTVIVPASS